MRTKIQITAMILFAGALTLPFATLAQTTTDGTLTFTFNESVSGASKNVMAVWIEDNAGTFVKTRMRFWGPGTNDHLPSWVSNSGQNTVDAITGATRTASTDPPAFGEKTVVWDGKDITGTTVADGTYKIFVESSWNNPSPPHNQHSDIIDFTFEKSDVSTHVTPTGNNHFSNITIDWVPQAVSVETRLADDNISLYPNPSNGMFKINFGKSTDVSRILVESLTGQVIYQEAVNNSVSGVKTIDLHDFPAGNYFVEVLSPDKSSIYSTKILISK